MKNQPVYSQKPKSTELSENARCLFPENEEDAAKNWAPKQRTEEEEAELERFFKETKLAPEDIDVNYGRPIKIIEVDPKDLF